MAITIQHKRGLFSNLPQLTVAEFALTTDTKQIFIGSGTENVEIAKVTFVTSQVSTLRTEAATNLQTAKTYADTAVSTAKTELETKMSSDIKTAIANIGVATTAKDGLLSKGDKVVLDGLASKQSGWDAKETTSGAQAKAAAAEKNAKDYADGLITDLVGTAPETLDTIQELAQAITELGGVDQGLISSIAGKADKEHKHAATDITESSAKRFVSDTEKSTWNAKATPADITSAVSTAKTALETSISTIQGEVNGLKTSKADASALTALANRVGAVEKTIDGGTF